MNLLFGWLWILLGLCIGMLMGLRFAEPDWLGGYDSHRRRLLRLGHISIIMLGILNILFAFSLPHLTLAVTPLAVASWALVAGAVTMPVCCALMAFNARLTMLFSIPVVSLLLAVGITCWGVYAS